MEIVESDTKNMGGKGPDGGRHPGRDDPYAGGQDKVNDSIMVPGEAVGMIIGKGMFVSGCISSRLFDTSTGGESIKEMQNSTGCKINVSPASGRDIEREIGLVGTRQAIDLAKRAIMEKVDAVVRAHPFLPKVNLR
jgi:far upstream element-binding protein